MEEKGAACALRAGKAVLCEKPAASDLAEYLTMHEASVKGGAVLLEAMRPAHDPSWQVISDALPQIGRIRHAAFEFCQYSSRYGRHMAGEHVNTFDPSFSNAALMDIGVYPLHCIVMLFGAPDEVTAKSVFLPDGFEASGEALLRYGSMTASAHYSKIYDSTRPSAISVTIFDASPPVQLSANPTVMPRAANSSTSARAAAHPLSGITRPNTAYM